MEHQRCGTLTIASAIANNGAATALTKAGPGTLILSSTNSNYTGGTYIAGGTLAVSADTNLGGAGTITINGGTLKLSANFTLSSRHLLSIGSSGGAISPTGGFNRLDPRDHQSVDRQRHAHIERDVGPATTS